MDRQQQPNSSGFTLVEVLIVLLILGILATIVVFAVRGTTKDSQQTTCKASSKTYQTAIEAWYAKAVSDRTDTNGDGHPSGPDIAADALIRQYKTEALVILEPLDPGHNGGPSSTVDPVASGPCDGLIAQA